MRWGWTIAIVLGLGGCSLLRPTPPPVVGGVQVGVASWYGPGFHGRPTASGEPFDQWALTAAHPSLPIGTRVRVTSLENGRAITVRINDRGPFVDGRVIDLSRAAAHALHMIGPGLMRVRIEVLRVPSLTREARTRPPPGKSASRHGREGHGDPARDTTPRIANQSEGGRCSRSSRNSPCGGTYSTWPSASSSEGRSARS